MTHIENIAIRTDSLSKAYAKGDQSIPAVDNVSLSIPNGQVFGLLGPNGAGKTTTIKMICGLVTPSSGKILVNGYEVSRDRRKVMRQIGAVLEGTRNIYWRLSAWENVKYFGRLKGCSSKRIRESGSRLLKELELWDRRNDPTRLFSRALVHESSTGYHLPIIPGVQLLTSTL